MTKEVTLEQLARTVGKPVEYLIGQMEKAGLPGKSAGDSVSAEEKMQLVKFLKKNDKVTLRHKTVSRVKVQSKTAGVGTVNVEIRRKKTLAGGKEQKEQPPPEPAVEKAEKAAETTQQPAKPAKRISAPGKLQTEKSSPPGESSPAERVSAQPSPVAEKKEERRELRVAQDKRGKRKVRKKRVRPEKVIQPRKQEFERPTAPVRREIEIPETISVGDLAQLMAIKSGQLIKEMIGMDMMATINQMLDHDTAMLVVEELGHTAKSVSGANVEESLLAGEPETEAEATLRPPVVTVMGHVDHGKTSLLDYIRKSRVAGSEEGGITQHIGAYHVKTDRGEITFLDTPGHAAFTAMRARGATATDVVVLVVAADDGLMPQTVEAIEHSRAAKVQIVVALNKIDKEDADPEKVKGDLAQKGIVPEDWGGQNIFVNISAKTGEGIDALLEAILLQAEVMELKAAVKVPAHGVVIESELDKGRGPMATVLVQRGVLKKGDILLAGQEFGRVRALLDESGRVRDAAGPSIPVVVLGLSGAPVAGEEVRVVLDERKAREIAEFRGRKIREGKLASQRQPMVAENVFEQFGEKQPSVLNVLIKADVQGSAEAIRDSLIALSIDEIENKIISSGIGGINESDIDFAAASGAVVIGFNVRADAQARKAAQAGGVQIQYYSVIYEVIDDMRRIMSGMLKPELKEKFIGLAEVKDVFRSSKMGAVAGCRVVEGMVKLGNPIRVLRDGVVVFEGGLESLRRHKDNVDEVVAGTECGIAVKSYNDIRLGDNIEVYEQIEVQREL